MSAGRFAMQLDAEFKREVEQKVLQVVQKISMEALSRVVLKTPVDTGRARGSWTVSVGTPDSSDPERVDPGGQQSISEGSGRIGGVREPDVIYVQSNLPYIEVLEGGHSQQAPNGMVALTVAEIESMFARVD